jgi:hypothetical protein
MIPSLMCRLFGHAWYDWGFAGTVRVFSRSAGRHVLKALTLRRERSHCRRCGIPNPAWEIQLHQDGVTPRSWKLIG